MKTIRAYVNRPIPRDLRAQLENTARVAHRMANTYSDRDVEVEITLRNRVNPNGYSATVDAAGAVRVSRFITLGWAKRHGYTE